MLFVAFGESTMSMTRDYELYRGFKDYHEDVTALDALKHQR